METRAKTDISEDRLAKLKVGDILVIGNPLKKTPTGIRKHYPDLTVAIIEAETEKEYATNIVLKDTNEKMTLSKESLRPVQRIFAALFNGGSFQTPTEEQLVIYAAQKEIFTLHQRLLKEFDNLLSGGKQNTPIDVPKSMLDALGKDKEWAIYERDTRQRLEYKIADIARRDGFLMVSNPHRKLGYPTHEKNRPDHLLFEKVRQHKGVYWEISQVSFSKNYSGVYVSEKTNNEVTCGINFYGDFEGLKFFVPTEDQKVEWLDQEVAYLAFERQYFQLINRRNYWSTVQLEVMINAAHNLHITSPCAPETFTKQGAAYE